MSEQTSGLRFDVYERVHLPEDVAAIDELEEIELIPRIAVIDEGEQAVLRGELLLNGVYRGQGEEEGLLVLEHRIPVEISLPMNRVHRLDDISIEIDNFDVDILSERTLNVTGVLSLRGLLMEHDEDEGDNSWSNEEFTAIHERSVDASYIEQQEGSDWESYEGAYDDSDSSTEEEEANERQDGAYALWQEEQQGEATEGSTIPLTAYATFEEPNYEAVDEEEQAGESFEFSARQPEESVQLQEEYESARFEHGEQETAFVSSNYAVEEQWEAAEEEAVWTQEEAPVWTQQETAETLEVAETFYEEEAAPVFAQQEATFTQDTAEEVIRNEDDSGAEQTEKQGLQIAFNSKKADRSDELGGAGLLTLLSSSKKEQSARQSMAELELANEAKEEAERQLNQEEDVEWKNMFLNKSSDDQSFKKIRVCIVQREETLEQIALRYSISPRELVQHNRLSESSITEGQLIYIPS